MQFYFMIIQEIANNTLTFPSQYVCQATLHCHHCCVDIFLGEWWVFSHSAVWTWQMWASCSWVRSQSRLGNPGAPVHSKQQTVFFWTAALAGKKGACCLDESSSSIDTRVSNVSERNSISCSYRQQLITAYSPKPSHLLGKQFFCHCRFNWSHQSTWRMQFLALNYQIQECCRGLAVLAGSTLTLVSSGQESADWWESTERHSCTKPCLFKHLETAFLANSIDFSSKAIRELSSVDSKQSIREIGCHCYDTNCLRCHLVPSWEKKTLFFSFFECVFLETQKKRRKRKRKELKNTQQACSIWIFTCFQYTFTHRVMFPNVCFDERPLKENCLI